MQILSMYTILVILLKVALNTITITQYPSVAVNCSIRVENYLEIKGRWPLVPRRQGYMVRLNFETTVN